jgi:hypothetical protein
MEIYHGYEISDAIADTARALWKETGTEHALIFVGDVGEAALVEESYDVVLCMYFTPGNLRDKSDDLSLYTDEYLDRNPRFIQIISRFYRAMKKDGAMFLTIYKDIPEAESAQWDFYEHTGQHVVTPRGARYVATAEGFWSARWTKKSMISNLKESGIDDRKVLFHDLNAISWIVEIRK